MLRIAYSKKSKPSALKIREAAECEVELLLHSSPEVDVNWGRNVANAALNPDISNVTNKRVMRQLFQEHNVPMPRLLGVVESLSDVVELGAEQWNYPVVGRPDQHSKGRGFWKCNSYGEVLAAIKGTSRKKAATHFMEYVEHDREYRVHIFKGKSIRISEKIYTDETKKEYTTGKPGDIKLRRVREAAKAAVESVGLDFGAVDVLARGNDNSEVWVLEVNAAPGVGGSMPKLYADTFLKYKNGEWDEE